MFAFISEFVSLHKRPLAVAAVVALLVLSSILIATQGNVLSGEQKSEQQTQQDKGSIAQTEESADPNVVPSLAMASQTIMQNGEFSISVEGFAPGETVFFLINDGEADAFKEVGRAKADAEGKVQDLTIDLPTWVTSGARNLAVEGQKSGRTIDSMFYVRADKPWVKLDSYAAKQDTKLALVAGGFEPGENVNIFFEGSPQDALASGAADQAGNTAWIEFSLRGLRAGEYRLILEGDQSEIRLSESIVISPRSPWVRLHVYTIGPGGSIGFDGHDFGPGEQLQVFIDEPAGEPISKVVADEAGNFTVDEAYSAKPDDVGPHRIIVVGELTAQATLTGFDVVPFTPAFQMTTYSGPPGTETSFNGNGFAPGETVKVFMQGQEQPVATIEVDDEGSFLDAGRFMVPRSANGGNLGITLIGQSSGARLTQGFSVVRVQPFLGLDRYAGQPGSMVRFQGLGFSAGETVTIYLGNRGGSQIATAITDSEGRFQNVGSFVIPGDATQDVAFTAVGTDSGAEASVKFQVILPLNESLNER